MNQAEATRLSLPSRAGSALGARTPSPITFRMAKLENSRKTIAIASVATIALAGARSRSDTVAEPLRHLAVEAPGERHPADEHHVDGHQQEREQRRCGSDDGPDRPQLRAGHDADELVVVGQTERQRRDPPM